MTMTKEEKIEILIEDKFWEWIYARCTDSLEDLLHEGFKGFDNYTDQELDDALDEIGEEKIEEIKGMVADDIRHKNEEI